MDQITYIWEKLHPYTNKPWKIVVIATITSPILSAMFALVFGIPIFITAVIGTLVAFILSLPLSWLIYYSSKTIERQNVELRELNQELDTYSHTVAHNIKNSLTTINLASQVIGMTKDPVKIYRHAHKIDTLSQSLSETVDALLLLASVRGEAMDIHPVNMHTAISVAKARLEYQIATYDARIRLPDDWESALGYTPWITEVWVNLLSNAIKYGGNSPIIRLGSDMLSDNSGVRFWVQDYGRGLDDDEKRELFKRFSKLERIDGHGLGLSIVAQIISRLGGEVGVESAGKGHGSLFYFTLPINNAPVTIENPKKMPAEKIAV